MVYMPTHVPIQGPTTSWAIHLLEIRVISTLPYNAVGARNL